MYSERKESEAKVKETELLTWMFDPLHTKVGEGAGLPHSWLGCQAENSLN